MLELANSVLLKFKLCLWMIEVERMMTKPTQLSDCIPIPPRLCATEIKFLQVFHIIVDRVDQPGVQRQLLLRFLLSLLNINGINISKSCGSFEVIIKAGGSTPHVR